MAAKFEHIKGYEDVPLPVRATGEAAGYDFVVARDIVVPSLGNLSLQADYERIQQYNQGKINGDKIHTLDETADIIKQANAKLTLVPTGVKCKLDPGTYLELSVRSSLPLKHWLILANGVGIIDADYYENEANDGEIFFQLINLTPWDIQLQKGDRIGQGIIKKYQKVTGDTTNTKRVGGFGSTDSAGLSAAAPATPNHPGFPDLNTITPIMTSADLAKRPERAESATLDTIAANYSISTEQLVDSISQGLNELKASFAYGG